jgi:hypothetical protein
MKHFWRTCPSTTLIHNLLEDWALVQDATENRSHPSEESIAPENKIKYQDLGNQIENQPGI